MQQLIRIEEFALAAFSLVMFTLLGYEWWWFVVWLLAPDISMVAYALGPRIGAIGYNLVHHKAVAVGLFVAGTAANLPLLQAASMVMLGHSSLDRVLGYGLKYADSFQHTHLGTIGKEQR